MLFIPRCQVLLGICNSFLILASTRELNVLLKPKIELKSTLRIMDRK